MVIFTVSFTVPVPDIPAHRRSIFAELPFLIQVVNPFSHFLHFRVSVAKERASGGNAPSFVAGGTPALQFGVVYVVFADCDIESEAPATC
jgi:hypothetical protein